MDEDPYVVLGVAPSASPHEIRTAWRRAALATHPDRHPGDPTAERRFRAVAEAYRILGDPGSRAAWDRRREPPPVGSWDGDPAPDTAPPEPVHPGPDLDPSVATRPGAARPAFLDRGLNGVLLAVALLVAGVVGYVGGLPGALLSAGGAAWCASPWGMDRADPLRPWTVGWLLLIAGIGLVAALAPGCADPPGDAVPACADAMVPDEWCVDDAGTLRWADRPIEPGAVGARYALPQVETAEYLRRYVLTATAVYHRGERVPSADPARFHVLDPWMDWAADAAHVYAGTALVPGADPATFRIHETGGVWRPFGVDGDRVYHGARLLRARPADLAVAEALEPVCAGAPGTRFAAYDVAGDRWILADLGPDGRVLDATAATPAGDTSLPASDVSALCEALHELRDMVLPPDLRGPAPGAWRPDVLPESGLAPPIEAIRADPLGSSVLFQGAPGAGHRVVALPAG